MDEQLSFGRWLQRRRRALGLTQAELGSQIGYAAETLRKVEADARRPTRQMAELLVEPLRIPAAERSAFLAFARPGGRLADLPPPVAAAASPRPLSPWPSAVLPTPLTALIGREQELVELQQLLSRDNVRLLTLTGPPGIGKTRLAIALAAALGDHYADGIAFVSLAPIAEPRLVVPTIARALGVPEAPELPLQEGLESFLRPKHLLLVLDNFEQVVAAAPELAELLSVAPGLAALITSRERLRVRGERVIVVPALSLPSESPSVVGAAMVTSVSQSAAGRLFVARAQDVQPDFAVTPANAGAISAICHRLDGLALAIALAAAHCRVLSPQALLLRMDEGPAALASGARDLPERQRSLRATIAWSYDRLSPAEQRFFRRLAVFVGGAVVAAAEAVGAQAWETESDTANGEACLDLLAALVDRSLLLPAEQAGPDGRPEVRFRMLVTIRAYAWERLSAAGEEAEAQRRHCAWCVDLAEQAEPELRGDAQNGWMDRLEREQANLRSALSWSLAHDPRAALRLGKGLWRFWRQRGYLREGRHWLDAILRSTADDRPEDRAARGWVYVGAGITATMQGDLEPARTYLDASVRAFRAADDATGLAQALRDLGYLMLISGDNPTTVRPVFQEALRIAQAKEDARAMGAALYLLALLAGHEREYEQAHNLTEESMLLFRRLGDRWSMHTSLWQLARLALAVGDLGSAQVHLAELTQLALQQHDRQLLGLATLGLAVLALRQSDLQQSERRLRDCLPLLHERHDPSVFAALGLLGGLAIRRGDAVRGVRLLTAGRDDRQWQRRTRTRIDPLSFLHAEEEVSLDQARAVLGAAAFQQAWAEGQAMSLEDALTLVGNTACGAVGSLQ